MKYPTGAFKFGRAHYDPNDLRAVVEYIDGVGFMKSMVTFSSSVASCITKDAISVAPIQQQMEKDCT